jgi:hypothetical protein
VVAVTSRPPPGDGGAMLVALLVALVLGVGVLLCGLSA